jgi:NADH-quinone oxidoreductase subunit K
VIGIEHYLVVSSILFVLGVLGHLPQPQERDRHPDGDRADPAGGEHQPRRLQRLPGRSDRPGLRDVRADRGGGEAAIGLAILVIYFRGRGTIAVDDINRMKG